MTTTRIDTRFAALKAEGRPALVTFVTGGDPDYETSLKIMKALPGAGADVIELGMPFSDPMADGPAIQLAGQRALKGGQTMVKTLEMVRAFRKGDGKTPIVLMGYYNPIYIYGVDRFLTDAREAGVDGLIIVDLPPEDGRGAVHSGRQGRAQLHPPRRADDGRQAPAARAAEHVGLRLLRIDHRHHRLGDAGAGQGRGHGRRASRRRQTCRSRSASASRPPSRRGPSARLAMASWSARPSSRPSPVRSTPTAMQRLRQWARSPPSCANWRPEFEWRLAAAPLERRVGIAS